MMSRYWINAPSTLQSAHHMHGLNVLANALEVIAHKTTICGYFVVGPVISAQVSYMYLSPGWNGQR